MGSCIYSRCIYSADNCGAGCIGRGAEAQADDPAVVEVHRIITHRALQKADVVERWFDEVAVKLEEWLSDNNLRDQLMAVAYARHILGHYEYGDTNLFEWSDGKVRAAILEELADAVVYQAWLLQRAEDARPY